ncbi:MAG: hypothetical protein ACRC7O_08825, partial [Fimbriiglobus sp.]
MTLAETLQRKLSDWRPTGEGRHSWSDALPEAGWTAQVSADKADTLGCLVWEFALTRTSAAPDGTTLRGWADHIAGRASGLLESLKVLEIDADRQDAILRSTAPARKGDAVLYYELKLAGLDRATLHRYTASTTAVGRREQTAFAVTHEALAKLAGD